METQLLKDALDDLASNVPSNAPADLAQLTELIESELPLQSYLENLLPVLIRVLGAEAGVVWLKAQGAPGAVFGIRYRFDEFVDSLTLQQKHERLVQIAWQQKQPMIAEPTAQTGDGLDQDSLGDDAANVEHNPTDHLLLFGPVLHAGESIALLEVLIKDSNSADEVAEARVLGKREKRIYLRAIQLLAEKIYFGLRERMVMPAPTLQQAIEQVNELSSEVKTLQQQIVASIEKRLQHFRGWSFSTLRENQAFAKLIHRVLDSHGLRVECPECGNPAILRCLRAGNAKNGAFVFDHYLDSGRTFHGGGTTVPLLKVVPKPARRPASSNS
ncbi:MAG: hypothetical protein ACE361_12555 [Aureliella sp.]